MLKIFERHFHLVTSLSLPVPFSYNSSKCLDGPLDVIVEIGYMEKEINNINPKKATTNNNILPKVLKMSSKVSASVLHTLASVLHTLFNDSIEKSEFPHNFKIADITPSVYKNNDLLDKTNYRPVSVLLVVSKISKE